ncbi:MULTISPECIES: FAD-binding oxidoreductase [unclassified Roseateles]|uniref:FAD-binding oxidoreductase n=1 Tax=unclassified Roseateles TaxID=2626991 RepID=UPI001621DF4C
MVRVSGWGRLSEAAHEVVPLADRLGVARQLAHRPGGIAHGMGRSYGDAALNAGGLLWATRGLDRFIDFDAASGRLTCEAGVLLRDIQRLCVPRGWMLAASPGTQLVTVGGAIANDVHGKNHHAVGAFGDHVRRLVLQRVDGTVIECGPDLRPDWFAATVGGIGLTGVIVQAELQLRPVPGPWLATESEPYGTLQEFFDLSRRAEADWEYTVSWIDCLSGGLNSGSARGLFMRGNHAPVADGPSPRKKGRRVPFTPPISLVNPLSLRAFNAAYFHMGRWRAGPSTQHYEPFFYPLDNLDDWNRIYGPRGFHQYQCVLPPEVGADGVQAMLAEIGRSGRGSFLAVLKTFGDRAAVGMLSFPRPGVTLALDFANTGPDLARLFERLDAIVAQAGGRLYLAKDSRMPRSLFEAGYPRLSEFQAYRDPGLSSEMSRRLMGE